MKTKKCYVLIKAQEPRIFEVKENERGYFSVKYHYPANQNLLARLVDYKNRKLNISHLEKSVMQLCAMFNMWQSFSRLINETKRGN